jgi:hypothetical protein
MRYLTPLLGVWALSAGQPALETAGIVKLVYVAPAGSAQFDFETRKQERGELLRSMTGPPDNRLTLETTYGADSKLLASKVTLKRGNDERTATVAVEEDRARVAQPGKKLQEFAVPAGVIVTSAPDWTDVVLLCRRFDRAKGGKQSFAALWIHPEQPAQLLTLTIERDGDVALDGGKLKLTRLLIHLRNRSAYYAWATTDGTLVRLLPAAAKDRRQGLILDEHAKDAGVLELLPPAS